MSTLSWSKPITSSSGIKEMDEAGVTAATAIFASSTMRGRPGIRVIAERFGVNPSTVQRISRPFDGASVAVA